MIYLAKSGEYYSVGLSEPGDGILDSLEASNPQLEVIGRCVGTSRDLERIRERMRSRSIDERGDWFRFEDVSFVRSLEGGFSFASERGELLDIRERYDASLGGSSERIVRMYDEMSSWWGSSGRGLESSLWRSRLLGCLDALRDVGSSVFGVYSGGEMLKGWDMRYFDGRVWSLVSEVEFRVSLQYFCVGDLGVSASEWLRHGRSFVNAVYEGAKLSPLSVSRSVVGFQNGVYDFSSPGDAVYHPFEERLPVVELLPYDYDMGSSCPMWEAFLAQVLDSSQVELLRRYLGLSVVDRRRMPYKVENSLWLVGPGGAGKSTIMNVVRHVVGEKSVSGVPLGSLLTGGGENRARFVALLSGKVFNYCGEIQMEDMTRGADSFKSLCSGEPQPMRRIGGNVEMAYDIPYLLFNMNRKPRMRGIDDALRRRLLFITFRTAVRESDRDPELEEKLKSEASGIRNWMMEGYRRFVEEGGVLSPTVSSADEGDLWLVENGQTVDLFMRKSGYRAYAYTGSGEKGEWVSIKSLFDRYSMWCSKWGYSVDVDLAGMGRDLRRMGYVSKHTSQGSAYHIYKEEVK